MEFVSQQDGSFAGPPGARSALSQVTGGYELVRHDQTRLRFDTAGRLTSLKERNDQGLVFTYDGAGRLATVTDSVGRQIALTYNGSGLLSGVALPDGRSVGYGVHERPADLGHGRPWQYEAYAYEIHGFLEKEIDPNQHTVFRNVYGDDGRVLEQYDALNDKTSFAWDPATQTATATDARSNQWKDVYAQGALVKRIDPLGNTIEYTYDADFNLTSVKDARGNTTTMTYDARGNLLTRTAPAPLSYQQVFTYDAQNNLLTARDGRGNTTSYTYDPAGNLTRITQPGSVVTELGRDPTGTGLLTSVIDPRGKVTTLELRRAGQPDRDRASVGRARDVHVRRKRPARLERRPSRQRDRRRPERLPHQLHLQPGRPAAHASPTRSETRPRSPTTRPATRARARTPTTTPSPGSTTPPTG